MSDILFTHSYFYQFDSKQWETKKPYPPLGTIYAAAFMREKGFSVSLFDTNLIDRPSLIEEKIAQESPKYLVIYDDGFNYLTKMCLTKMREAAFEISAIGKRTNCKVIVSSSDSTDHYGLYLDAGADFVLLGEAELTLLDLIQNLEKGNDQFDGIPGIAFKKDGQSIKNTRRPVLKELDMLPTAAWDLVDVEPYRKIWESHGTFELNIATTRGCPFKCNWCAKPIYGNRYNTRSPERVVDEIQLLSERHGVRKFWMCDDIFGLKPGWVQSFRDELKKRNLSIAYTIQSRVDLLLKEDTIDALAASGLKEVWVGAESGSQKILDAMDKGTKVEQIYEATKLLKAKGVRVAFFLQFGYLGEEKEDIDKTVKMLTELLPDDIGISVSYPLPGTKFYEKVKDDLRAKSNWSDSDDLDMMFEGTFDKPFYKRLHRYVHKEYRKHQGIESLRSILRNPLGVSKAKLRSALLTFYYTPGAMIDRRRLQKLQG